MEADSQQEMNRQPDMNNQMISSGRSVQEMNQDMSGATELLPPEELQEEEQEHWKDYEYFLRMLPVVAREVWAAADAILDRYEFEGSSMYAEYPDKTAIFKIVEMIYAKLKYYENSPTENRMDGTEGKNYYYIPREEQGINTPLRELIFIMVSWNMAFRRQRYRRRKKIFPIS